MDHLGRDAVRAILTHTDPACAFFSLDEQLFYNKVARILIRHYLAETLTLDVLSMRKLKKSLPIEHLMIRHSPSARDNVTSSYSYSKQESSRLEPPQSSYLKPPSDRSPNIRVNSPKRSSPSGYENYKSNFNYSSNKPGTRSPFDEMKRSFDDLKRSSVELREPVKYP